MNFNEIHISIQYNEGCLEATESSPTGLVYGKNGDYYNNALNALYEEMEYNYKTISR
jgi:hypothetical protein